MSTPVFTADDPVDLTVRLVETPSVSGGESAVVGLIAEGLRAAGLRPIVTGRNVHAVVEGKRPGRHTLLLQGHIDTVPAGQDWTRDPWRASREDGRIYGLGSNDTKGGVAAMICAFADLAKTRDFGGTLVFAATCDEETGGEGLETLRPHLPPLTGAVIAEPTTLRVCTAQRGLMRIVVACHGRSAHASRPWQGSNAIELALADIAALRAIEAPDVHPLLGRTTCTPTMIEGGVGSNVVPPLCRYTLDVRPTPNYPNAWWEERIRATVQGEIEVFRGRMVPVETEPGDRLVQAALLAAATGDAAPFGGVSDLFHVRDVAGVVLGPGRSEQSHSPDEWVEEEQVRAAVAVYRDLVLSYLTGEAA